MGMRDLTGVLSRLDRLRIRLGIACAIVRSFVVTNAPSVSTEMPLSPGNLLLLPLPWAIVLCLKFMATYKKYTEREKEYESAEDH